VQRLDTEDVVSNTNKDKFLGSGMKFPPQVNRATGRFEVSSGVQSVKESIYIILRTAAGERWLQPGFGSRLGQYAFMDVNLTGLNMLKNDIRRLLTDQEPRVADVDVEIDPDEIDNCLVINIVYRVGGVNTVDNLVFPFYLKADAGVTV
jgi:phage baseplate assembly protein W